MKFTDVLLRKHTVFLFVIFVGALILRVYNLSSIPNGLHVDELNAGYQGYKIIKTGSDIFGEKLPIFINRFGDYRPAGIFYLTGLFIALFDMTTFFTRLPSALIGALSVVSLFFLTRIIAKNTTIALLSSFLLAISPWHIVASRATSESIVALFLTITGVTLLLHVIEHGRFIFFAGAFFLLLLSYFFYHTPRFFIPAFLIFLSICLSLIPKISDRSLKKVNKKPLLFLTLFFIAITIGFSLTSFGRGRFDQTSIFISDEVRKNIKTLEDTDGGNIFLARLFHNKPVVFVKEFIDQYDTYFSSNFLFLRGGYPHRYEVPDAGLLYYIEFPLLFIGFYFLVRRKSVFFFVPIIWLLLGPVAASFTNEDTPNIQRAIFMLPAFQIISAFGLYAFFAHTPKRFLRTLGTLCILLLFVNGIYFFHQYFVHTPSSLSFTRNDGNDTLFDYLSSKEKENDVIYMPLTDDFPLYYSFFQLKKDKILSISRSDYSEGVHIGKYVFVPHECPEHVVVQRETLTNNRVIVVSFPRCGKGTNVLIYHDTIVRKDTTEAYYISTFKREEH